MAANKIVNNSNKSKKQPDNSIKSIETRLKSVKSVKTNKFLALKEKNKKNNKKSAKIEKKKKTSDVSSINKEKKLSKDIISSANTNKNKILNIKENVSIKTTGDKNAVQTINNAIKPEKSVQAAKFRQNNAAAKIAPYETADNIILLKRKMHKEIFQRCLERKLLTNMEVWEEHETSVDSE